jgi:excisionase family DNA binding protein
MGSVRRLVSINQAAEHAAISTKTVRRKIASGEIEAFRAGKIIRVDLDSVDRWLKPVVADGAA